MRFAAWFIGIVLTLALGPAAAAQTMPDYSPPKDLSAGFDPNTLFGADPKVKRPDDSWAAEVLKDKIWSGGVELGLAGGAGSTNVFKFRTGLTARRDKDGNVLNSDLMYVMSEVSGEVTEN